MKYSCNRCGYVQDSSAQCGMCCWGDLYPIKPHEGGTCCALGCGKPLPNKFNPFCDECMKNEELIKAWEEL